MRYRLTVPVKDQDGVVYPVGTRVVLAGADRANDLLSYILQNRLLPLHTPAFVANVVWLGEHLTMLDPDQLVGTDI